VATIVTCVLGLVLARATFRITERRLPLGLRGIRAQVDTGAAHQAGTRLRQRSRIVVTNLAKIPVLLQIMQIHSCVH